MVRAEGLDATGIALISPLLKRLLGAICDELDHRNLNELPPFQQENASSEGPRALHLPPARSQIPEPARLLSVTVWGPEIMGTITEPRAPARAGNPDGARVSVPAPSPTARSAALLSRAVLANRSAGRGRDGGERDDLRIGWMPAGGWRKPWKSIGAETS